MSKISLMVKLLAQAAFAVPLVLVAAVSYPASTQAQTPSSAPSRDVKPQAGCLSGYPDGTYKGDRPVTRYEFAAGMNACLERVNQLLPNRDNLATRADFEALIERQRQLNQQLRELNQRVNHPAASESSSDR
jgi:hypothetical protein